MTYQFTRDVKEMDAKKGEDYTVDNCVKGSILALLLATGIIEEVRWPQKEDVYAFFTDMGNIVFTKWMDDKIDHSRRDFLGIYPTQSAAEAARDEIKKFIKERK